MIVVSNSTPYDWTVNNTLITCLNVTKVWNDGNNADNTRPEFIIVELFADSVKVDEASHTLSVIVNEDQSKVAFGRKAQNVRLAGKLVGWTIKLCDETSKERAPSIEEKMKIAAGKLVEELGISAADAATLVANGFVTVEGLKAAEDVALDAVANIDHAALRNALENIG